MPGLFTKKKKYLFNRLYDMHAERLFLLVLRYVVSQFDAEEVVQRGFIKVYDGLSKFKHTNDKATLGWLSKIMVNEALLFLREQKRLVLNDFSETESSYRQLALVEGDLNYEDYLKLVRNLPDGYRTVFNLYAIEGYSHKEIGDLLGISESASRSQLSRARSILKEQLKSSNYANEYVG